MQGLSEEQREHKAFIIDKASRRIDAKYTLGAIQHQGLLSDKSIDWLIENAIAEAIDQVVYLLTLREKL